VAVGSIFKIDEARRRLGAQVDRYVPLLEQADPLADAVVAEFATMLPGAGQRMLQQALDDGIASVAQPPASLTALFAQLDAIPTWVDWERMDRGGAAFIRAGAFGALTVMLYALPLSYRSPAGVKPLVFSGRLLTAQIGHRLGETAHFVVAVCQPGSLRRDGEGFKITVKVRVMHAQIRRHILNSGRWQESWGAPINQPYMAGTILLFSGQLLTGLRRLGYRTARRDAEALLHLWRYCGYLSGVVDDLLCTSEQEAARLSALIMAVDGDADEDGRRLVKSLMDACMPTTTTQGRWSLAASYGASRALMGRDLADQLGLPKTPWRFLVPVLRPVVSLLSLASRLSPRASHAAEHAGAKGWATAIYSFLGDKPAEFLSDS